ncbi:MAG: hypothetical protein K6G50_04120 [bacterium]|nr:hypothetical protein [bacterium]
MNGKKQLVLRTYERKEGGIPSGKYITRRYNLAGNPFVVFCTNEFCPHWINAEGALPHWSEDCPENLGVLRCPECGAPVVRPETNPDCT